MKRIFYSTLILLSGAAIFSSCNKDDDGGNDLPRYATVQEAMASVAPKPVTLTVDAVSGGSYKVGSSRLIVPPGAFRTFFGAPVAGNISVEVLELLNKSDMALSRVLPVGNGEQLVTAGEFRITANQNGTQLQLRDKVPVELRVPQFGFTATGAQYYQGMLTNDTAGNIVNWINYADPSSASKVTIDGDTVSILSDSLGYIGAHRLLSKTAYQSFTVTVSAPDGVILTNTNVAGFAFFDAYRTVWPMNTFLNSQFSETHLPNLPLHFVVFAVVNGTFYAGIGKGVPSANANFNVTLLPSTPLTFKAQVEELN